MRAGDDFVVRGIVAAVLRTGRVSIQTFEPTIKDPISQLVVEALFSRGPQNVSQVTEYVRSAKGSASRTTIRQRINQLSSKGFVSRLNDSEKWALTANMINRWKACLLNEQIPAGTSDHEEDPRLR